MVYWSLRQLVVPIVLPMFVFVKIRHLNVMVYWNVFPIVALVALPVSVFVDTEFKMLLFETHSLGFPTGANFLCVPFQEGANAQQRNAGRGTAC